MASNSLPLDLTLAKGDQSSVMPAENLSSRPLMRRRFALRAAKRNRSEVDSAIIADIRAGIRANLTTQDIYRKILEKYKDLAVTQSTVYVWTNRERVRYTNIDRIGAQKTHKTVVDANKYAETDGKHTPLVDGAKRKSDDDDACQSVKIVAHKSCSRHANCKIFVVHGLGSEEREISCADARRSFPNAVLDYYERLFS